MRGRSPGGGGIHVLIIIERVTPREKRRLRRAEEEVVLRRVRRAVGVGRSCVRARAARVQLRVLQLDEGPRAHLRRADGKFGRLASDWRNSAIVGVQGRPLGWLTRDGALLLAKLPVRNVRDLHNVRALMQLMRNVCNLLEALRRVSYVSYVTYVTYVTYATCSKLSGV